MAVRKTNRNGFTAIDSTNAGGRGDYSDGTYDTLQVSDILNKLNEIDWGKSDARELLSGWRVERHYWRDQPKNSEQRYYASRQSGPDLSRGHILGLALTPAVVRLEIGRAHV